MTWERSISAGKTRNLRKVFVMKVYQAFAGKDIVTT
jgi:hypothetical protein